MEKLEFIDTHAHLNFAAYDQDREKVIKRSLENNTWMINVGTQKDTSEIAVELAEKYQEGVYAIVGIHPIHTDKSFHDQKELGSGNTEFNSRGEVFDYEFYKNLAQSPKVVGIGECGLDYFRTTSESEKKQREAFSAQIALANELKKPLMLHVRNGENRSAYRDALEILKSEARVSGNFHFFAGDWQEAKEILDAGFNLSFTGVITFSPKAGQPGADAPFEVIKNTPLDRIMSETDCPYVAPVPYRGKRNEPLYVKEVVKKIAEVREEESEIVEKALLFNALQFFDFDSKV